MTKCINNVNSTEDNINSRIKLVVYTVLVGTKEQLNDPLQLIPPGTTTDIDIDYFCLTDNEKLTSSTWRFRKFTPQLVPIEKASRLPKSKPHEFFRDYEYSLYIDNTVVFKRLPCISDIKGKIFAAFKHPWRNNPLDEADVVVRSGLDNFEIVSAQLSFYKQNGTPLDSIKKLTAGTVLLRNHNIESVKLFGENWWEQILLFSKRDQICIDLCAEISNCKIEYFEGDKTQNDLFMWPVVLGGKRILGSFDAEKYKWLNRDDPKAILDPKLHFMMHKNQTGDYDRKTPLLEYSSRRKESGLSEIFGSRRAISKIIGKIINENANVFSNIMVAGITNDSKFTIYPEELIQAKESLLHYYRFSSTIPNIVTALNNENELEDPAPFIGSNENDNFEFVIIIGIPIKQHQKVLSKYNSLLSSHGKIMLVFNEGLSVQEILDTHSSIGYKGKLEIFHGQHILHSELIPSSILVINHD